jgi:hypothetical protein
MTAILVVASACVSTPSGGALQDGADYQVKIAGVDSAFPPRAATVQLDRDSYAALLLIAPGHSATLLYPADSTTSNRLTSGTHQLRFDIPSALAETDSQRLARIREAQRNPARRGSTQRVTPPIPPSTPTFLLLVTSPQPLVYQRMIEKTGGVTIPTMEDEALNAVAKAIKSTIETEPRQWAGFYLPVELRRYR